ncbi:MAG: hypothetical protein ABI640_05310 [Gammaproteobacteria bacterium]
MSALRTTLRWLMWATTAIVAVPVLLYAFAFAVNWRDQPPNAEALDLAAAPLPELIPDSANAYVYLLGFAAPRVGDPVIVGTQRADWIRALAANSTVDRASDPYPGSARDFQEIPEPLMTILAACGAPDAGCVAALEAAGDLRAQLEEQRPLIERYRTLLGYRAWRDITTGDLRGPLMSYLEPHYAHRLFLLDTWLLAATGDAKQVESRLEADVAFWRMALVESDSLWSKVIAAGSVSSHFDWGNLILRHLPPERRADGVPATWRKTISGTERSMRRAFAYEWRFSRSALLSTKAYGTGLPLRPGAQDSRSWGERIETSLAWPFLKVQDTVNRDAAALSKLDTLLALPYTDFATAFAKVPEIGQRETGIVAVTYNFFGTSLFLIPERTTAFADYGARVADLEGVRRAALMTVDLRNLAVPATLAGAMIPLAAVRDPYTGGPFGWTAEPPAVTFTGLEHRPAHSFLY